MSHSTKKIALFAFASLLSGTVSANTPLPETSNDTVVDQSIRDAFENLWEAGLIKTNPQTGQFMVDDELIKKLKELGGVKEGQFSKSSPDSSGVCL